jgi:hypothetical protein
MKDHFESALAVGACVIIGCGVIAMAFGTVSGLIGAFIAMAIGGRLLQQAWKLSHKE